MSDPFATFGLTPAFELDLNELEQRHRELSRALHPDRYAGRGASERRQALGKAIEVNEAWRRLKNPVKRAEALLERLGLAVSEEQEPKPAPEFLMDVMERREELDRRVPAHSRAPSRCAAAVATRPSQLAPRPMSA